jgi:hypothetical protein
MATPPPPPPREPSFLPREKPRSPWRDFLKVALLLVGGAMLLLVVGVGLLAATCLGLAQ